MVLEKVFYISEHNERGVILAIFYFQASALMAIDLLQMCATTVVPLWIVFLLLHVLVDHLFLVQLCIVLAWRRRRRWRPSGRAEWFSSSWCSLVRMLIEDWGLPVRQCLYIPSPLQDSILILWKIYTLYHLLRNVHFQSYTSKCVLSIIYFKICTFNFL